MIHFSTGLGLPSEHPACGPRLWSLWEVMINFNIYELSMFLHLLELEETTAPLKSGPIPEVEKSSLENGVLNYGKGLCEKANLTATLDRIERTRVKLSWSLLWSDWGQEARVLRETLTDQLKEVYCYHYPLPKAKIYWATPDAWKQIFVSFPSVSDDVFAAVDCYALDRNTASVFHSMRVAEIGLRALARERRVKVGKKPLEWAAWQEVITGIRGAIKKIEGTRAGPAKSAALDFYNGSLGEFEAFKDAYRNDVNHARKSYDENQALSVLNHVREFMTRLSARIDEKQTKQIKWGLPKSSGAAS